MRSGVGQAEAVISDGLPLQTLQRVRVIAEFYVVVPCPVRHFAEAGAFPSHVDAGYGVGVGDGDGDGDGE